MLATGAHIFCHHIHRDRPDDVQLFHYKTPELVSQVAIVQHIKESTPQGAAHRFRLFHGTEFLPDIYLNGRTVAFAGHVLERFNKRVPHRLGEGFRDLFLSFYGGYMFRMPISAGHAFVVPFLGSALTYTFKETAEEYFITTCLSVRETHGLKLEDPAQLMYFHYGPTSHRLRTQGTGRHSRRLRNSFFSGNSKPVSCVTIIHPHPMIPGFAMPGSSET